MNLRIDPGGPSARAKVRLSAGKPSPVTLGYDPFVTNVTLGYDPFVTNVTFGYDPFVTGWWCLRSAYLRVPC